jgi:hypothetical protein
VVTVARCSIGRVVCGTSASALVPPSENVDWLIGTPDAARFGSTSINSSAFQESDGSFRHTTEFDYKAAAEKRRLAGKPLSPAQSLQLIFLERLEPHLVGVNIHRANYAFV